MIFGTKKQDSRQDLKKTNIFIITYDINSSDAAHQSLSSDKRDEIHDFYIHNHNATDIQKSTWLIEKPIGVTSEALYDELKNHLDGKKNEDGKLLKLSDYDDVFIGKLTHFDGNKRTGDSTVLVSKPESKNWIKTNFKECLDETNTVKRLVPKEFLLKKGGA